MHIIHILHFNIHTSIICNNYLSSNYLLLALSIHCVICKTKGVTYLYNSHMHFLGL